MLNISPIQDIALRPASSAVQNGTANSDFAAVFENPETQTNVQDLRAARVSAIADRLSKARDPDAYHKILEGVLASEDQTGREAFLEFQSLNRGNLHPLTNLIDKLQLVRDAIIESRQHLTPEMKAAADDALQQIDQWIEAIRKQIRAELEAQANTS